MKGSAREVRGAFWTAATSDGTASSASGMGGAAHSVSVSVLEIDAIRLDRSPEAGAKALAVAARPETTSTRRTIFYRGKSSG